MQEYILAITGASGVVYGQRLAQFFEEKKIKAYLVISDHAKQVIGHELGISLASVKTGDLASRFIGRRASSLMPLDFHDMMAPIASGSRQVKAMAIVPCSMSTVSAVAHGTAKSLIERAADVMLKERRRFVMVPRETPLSTLHLANLHALSQMGVQVIPAMPAFYNRPKGTQDMVDFIVGRVLDYLEIKHDLYPRWKENGK